MRTAAAASWVLIAYVLFVVQEVEQVECYTEKGWRLAQASDHSPQGSLPVSQHSAKAPELMTPPASKDRLIFVSGACSDR